MIRIQSGREGKGEGRDEVNACERANRHERFMKENIKDEKEKNTARKSVGQGKRAETRTAM